jgi:hypothetical protein
LNREERTLERVAEHDRRPLAIRTRWPGGFLGMLAIVIVSESGLARLELRLAPMAAADWGLNRAEAAREAVGADILCLGDSLIKCGVSPAVLEAKLGLTAYNLASLGAPPPASYFLLRRSLDAGARPRAIVLDATSTTLTAAAYRGLVRNWAALLGPREAFMLARDDRDSGFLGVHLVHYLIPSVRMRLDLRKAAADELAGGPAVAEVAWGPIVERQHAINRGAFHRSPTHPKEGPDPFPGGVLPPHEEAVCYPAGWTPYPTNLVYLDKTLALAESRGLPVFFLVPPIHPGVQAGRQARGLDASFMMLVRKIHARHANVTVVDGRRAGFGHGAFADAQHLDREGAAALSIALADAMRPQLTGRASGDRWVALPMYADPTDLPDIEDMAESAVALARGAARR